MIISASRRTDIPAFYSDWFMRRVEEGFVLVRNPMNANQVRRVSLAPEDVDCIVFWTKNPKRMLDKLRVLDERKLNYYFQFTLTPYHKAIEPNLPEKNEVIATFIELSDRIGRERVIWRYDPIVLTSRLDREYHYQAFERLAKQLSGRTEKCVISFVDFYAKCRKRLSSLEARDIARDDIYAVSEAFSRICRAYGLKLETCAEETDLRSLGIAHGKCIDDALVSRIAGRTISAGKDKVQRELCGCVASVDIGEYNTCPHNCLYCYANYSKESVARKQSQHDELSPLLSGCLKS
jgi:DNA repair photolyase